jgi:eukaryotic-like serine/threonine-protein kinase
VAQPDIDHNLLFGLVALRSGLVEPTAAAAALRAWAHDGDRPVVDYLVERGDLDDARRARLLELVGLRLEAAGGDFELALAALAFEGLFPGNPGRFRSADLQATVVQSDADFSADLRLEVAEAAFEPGAGRFRVLRLLARGGLGNVYVALDSELNREVALKQLQDQHADDPASRARFLVEAEITGGLEHPGIVPVYGLGTDETGHPFYIMRLIRGQTFKDAIEAFHADPVLKRDGGRRSLELRKLLRRFVDVCNAVDYAHSRGVLHRDLKPGNVILGRHGETLVVDWGLAKPTGRAEPEVATGEWLIEPPSASMAGGTLPGSAMGTPSYMSPEQAAGDMSQVGPRSDVYGLGATLYCLLTARPPFEGRNLVAVVRAVRAGDFLAPRQVDPALNRRLEAICLKAMAREPARRYATPRALAEDVERWMADEPVSALAETLGDRLSRWERRNRVLIRVGGAALVLVTLVSLAASLLVSSSRQREHEQFVEANRLKGLSDHQRRQAEALSRDLRRQSIHILLEEGTTACAAGDVAQGLLELTRGLQLAPEEADLERLIRTDLDGWTGRLFPLTLHLSHGNRVRAVFSRDGAFIATASDDHTARVWETGTGRPATPPLMHGNEVNDVAFSPDGRLIVTACDDCKARIWEVATGRPLHTLSHAGGVNAAVFSPDGRWVLTASQDGTARVWDAATGAPRTPPLSHARAVNQAVFSPDGTRVATASDDNAARVWDAVTGAPRTAPLTHAAPVRNVAFSPDGAWLASASVDATARVWNAADGAPSGSPLNHRANVNSVVFSPDGKQLLTASDDGTAQLWRLSDHRPLLSPLTHKAGVLHASFSPDGQRIATASQDGTARVWEAATGRPQGSTLRHRNWVYSAKFSPDGNLLLTPSRDFTARVWDVRPARPILALEGHRGVVQSATYSRDGARIAAAGEDGSARVWDARTGTLLRAVKHPDGKGIRSVAFSPDGRRIATAGYMHEVILWDVATGATVGAPLKQPGPILDTGFSPDGSLISTAGLQGEVLIRETATGRVRATLQHRGPVLEASFDAAGGRIVTASADRSAQIWDVATGRPIGAPFEHSSEVWSAAFSPDGRKVITAGQENAATIWDVASGRPEQRLLGHKSYVNAARFSPDGRTALTASDDTTCQLWDVASGLPLGPPWQLRGDARSVSFSPDGTRVLLAGADRVVSVFPLPVPLPGAPERIAAWVKSQTGLGDDPRATDVLDGPAWEAARRRLDELGGPPR